MADQNPPPTDPAATPSTTNPSPLATFRAALAALKQDPHGACELFPDGVLRSFTGHTTRHIVDAIGLSPAQIKQALDLRPWSQAVEDQYRGVDGRTVVGHAALFDPPDAENRPRVYTDEEWVRLCEEKREEARALVEERERVRREGGGSGGCVVAISDFDLSPRVTRADEK